MVIYHNDKTNFSVFKMKYRDGSGKGSAHTISCAGVINDIRKGYMLKLYGNFETNQYGNQFKFRSFEYSSPEFYDEIMEYLSGGLISQVDEITAQKIYDAFGEETIQVLDEDPERVLEIKGIGKKKAQKIIDSWKLHRDNLDTYMLLQKYGLSINTIDSLRTLAKDFNTSILNLLKKESYNLVYNNDKLSFDTMDMLLSNILPKEYEYLKNSYKRVQCCIYSFLVSYTFETGNVCAPYYEILNKVVSQLGLSKEEIYAIIQDHYPKLAEEDRRIYIEDSIAKDSIVDSVGLVYTDYDYRYESYIANILMDVYKQKNDSIDWFNSPKRRKGQVRSMVDNVGNVLDVTYNEEQKVAIESVLKNPITIITGGPGTGKTTVIKAICEILNVYESINTLLLAPTGKAAKRMSEATNRKAQTLHLAIHTDDPGLYDSGCIIIDEASMIDNALMSMFLTHINPNQRLVFVGDINQLPSVGPGNVLSNMIQSKIFPTVVLNQIYRQKNGYIISNAHKINNGEMPDLYSNDSNDFYFIDSSSIQYYDIEGVLSKLVKELMPTILSDDQNFIKDLQILSPMRKTDTGINNINNIMYNLYKEENYKKYLISKERWHISDLKDSSRNNLLRGNIYPFSISKDGIEYSVGCRVINNKNDYDKVVFNGEVGYIQQIRLKNEILEKIKIDRRFRSDGTFYDSDYDVDILFDDRVITFSYDDLINISLAYCLTIHKSQGSEYKYMIMFLNSSHWIMLQRNLLYTGITRAKKMIILISDVPSIQRAVTNNIAIDRLTLLKERIELAKDGKLKALCVAPNKKELDDSEDVTDEDFLSSLLGEKVVKIRDSADKIKFVLKSFMDKKDTGS